MSRSTIYVFSATGNSLTTALQLQKELPDCKVLTIASLLNNPVIAEESEMVGFVFPVYFQDVPYPVKQVIEKMQWRCENPYVFCMSTSRNVPSTDLVYQRLNQVLKETGVKLSLALSVPMPGNSWMNAPDVDERYLNNQKQAVQKLSLRLLSKEVKDYDVDQPLPLTPVSYPKNYRGLLVEDACIGCGRCVSVCPMNNISLEQKKAVISDACAICLACFHWCPQEAIYMSQNMEDGRRKKYHHPDVTFEQIVQCKTR